MQSIQNIPIERLPGACATAFAVDLMQSQRHQGQNRIINAIGIHLSADHDISPFDRQ